MEQCDSRPRIKLVKKGQPSPSVSPYFGGPTELVSETPHHRSLENLAQSANQWLTLKKTLSHDGDVRALKTLTERNHMLAAILRANLSSGTLHFRTQMPAEQIRPSQPKRKLYYLVVNDPSKVEIFRKFHNRKSGRKLFKPFKGKIVKVTGSMYITDKERVMRRNHIAVRLKSTSVGFSGKQATPVKKGQKRPIVSTSSSTSPDDNDLSNRLIRNLVSLLKQYQFLSVPVLLFYCRQLRLCGPILWRASWLTILCWTPQAFDHLFAMLHLWWTLQPLPLRQQIYSQMCLLVLNRRHLLLLNFL